MTKSLVASLALAALAALASSGTVAAEPRLRPAIAIDTNQITLGDLFENAGTAGAVVVARAPAPGERFNLPLIDIAAAANSAGLRFANFDPRHAVLVVRNGKPIADDLAFDEVRAALQRHAVGGDMRVEFGSRNLRLQVGRNDAETVAVRDLTLDDRSGRFSASVSAPADDPSAARVRVFGNAWRVIQIPVLARPVPPGQVIGERDLSAIEMRADRVGLTVVTDPASIVGMTPARPVAAGQPIGAQDIRRPVVVTRNSTVTMVYSLPGVTLTAIGKAMDEGGIGDTIRISNLQSRNVVTAVVEGSDLVRIPPRGAAALRHVEARAELPAGRVIK